MTGSVAPDPSANLEKVHGLNLACLSGGDGQPGIPRPPVRASDVIGSPYGHRLATLLAVEEVDERHERRNGPVGACCRCPDGVFDLSRCAAFTFPSSAGHRQEAHIPRRLTRDGRAGTEGPSAQRPFEHATHGGLPMSIRESHDPLTGIPAPRPSGPPKPGDLSFRRWPAWDGAGAGLSRVNVLPPVNWYLELVQPGGRKQPRRGLSLG
jgi:hypothetical protein